MIPFYRSNYFINRSGIKANTNENEAITFLEQYNEEYGALLNSYVKASWNYETNLIDANAILLVYKP